MTAPSWPTCICERWSSPTRTRSTKPNASVSHATAARTSGYTSTGITVAVGIDRFSSTPRCYGSGQRPLPAVTAAPATNGYTPQQASDLYITDGSIDDWMWRRHRIFSFTLEMFPVSGQGGFYPDDAHHRPGDLPAHRASRMASTVPRSAQVSVARVMPSMPTSRGCHRLPMDAVVVAATQA
jgi:hypothetical protein